MIDPIRPAEKMVTDICIGSLRQTERNDEWLLTIIEADRETIRADERAKVVAWLRDRWANGPCTGETLHNADAIERGEHTGGDNG